MSSSSTRSTVSVPRAGSTGRGRAGRASGTPSTRGRYTLNVVPLPTSLYTQM